MNSYSNAHIATKTREICFSNFPILKFKLLISFQLEF